MFSLTFNVIYINYFYRHLRGFNEIQGDNVSCHISHISLSSSAWIKNIHKSRDLPGGPWLRLCTSNEGGVSSIFSQKTKIPHAVWRGQKIIIIINLILSRLGILCFKSSSARLPGMLGQGSESQNWKGT